ncbi:2-dehydropantoate 2-reductase [Pseudomonas marincola]|uniref:2-dehydropantoate 2-reductase n=1 Tax=Pseudomonas marincola TaxID=437900 RepID=A0A653E9B8_9PSED|nr:putative 2-dehydropantoate 2-reductase [Pseudomonas marincola]CAE6924940.1 2-dehydropantoate 2-reductase [Pseudomonas marincola]
MSSNTKPRIGIVGTGAIGGFYGVMLAKAGFDVHFLLRSEYAAVEQNGLQINSQVHGPMTLAPVQAYRSVENMPVCDWLLVGAKTTSNGELAPIISQLAGPDCKVILLQNGLGVEEALRPLLPDTLHLLGGLCYICVARSAPGVVEHQALGAINLGYHSGPADAAQRQAILEQGVGLFKAAGIDSAPMANLEQARWQKLAWNVPYNGLSVLLNADTQAMMANPDSHALVAAMMQEVVDTAAACGHQLPEGIVGKLLGATARMPEYLPSMYHDFAHRRPAELPALYQVPLAAAKAAGVSMPKVEALYQALRFLEQRNN